MLHVLSYKLCAKLLSCLFFPTFSALARWQNDALSEVLARKLGLCRERFPCVCLAVLLAEVVCNGQVDAGIFRFHPSFAHQEFRMPAAVITCCVQQVVCHQPYAQLLAEESLSGSQVEIAADSLPCVSCRGATTCPSNCRLVFRATTKLFIHPNCPLSPWLLWHPS